MTGTPQSPKTTDRKALAGRVAAIASVNLPEVGRALEDLWSYRGARHAWALALIRTAAHAKGAGPGWVIEYPPGWAEDERSDARHIALTEAGILPGFIADPRLRAGLRLRAGDRLLDASPAGLLAEDGRLNAALQRELASVPPRLL